MSLEVLIALVDSTDDRNAIERGACGTRVHFCSRARDVIDLLPDLRVVGVVLELRAASSKAAVRALIDAIDHQGRLIPLLLRFEVRSRVFREHAAHFSEEGRIQYSVRGFDELSTCVASLLAASAVTSARMAIVAQLLPVVHGDVRSIVTGAATIGERDYAVPSLAKLCGLSPRTLDQQCVVAKLPTPKRLLMKMLVAHTHYRVTELDMTPKRAASAAELTSDELSRRVERQSGHTLVQFCKKYSFADVMSEFAAELRG
jgi:hypothetical protein